MGHSGPLGCGATSSFCLDSDHSQHRSHHFGNDGMRHRRNHNSNYGVTYEDCGHDEEQPDSHWQVGEIGSHGTLMVVDTKTHGKKFRAGLTMNLCPRCPF